MPAAFAFSVSCITQVYYQAGHAKCQTRDAECSPPVMQTAETNLIWKQLRVLL